MELYTLFLIQNLTFHENVYSGLFPLLLHLGMLGLRWTDVHAFINELDQKDY